MKPQIRTSLLLLALMAPAAPLLADTLALPPQAAPEHADPAAPMDHHADHATPAPAAGSAPEAAFTVEMPARGMTMEKVEDLFGAPLERQPPVGDPPITRWIYPDFVVVFEHQWVINSVLTRGQPQPR